MESIRTYCVECDEELVAPIQIISDKIIVKGEPIEYNAKVAICPNCNVIIADSRLEGENLKTAYAKYCDLHNLVKQNEIVELRQAMGLSLREFSKFLGFGEQTAAKYEKGSIPDLLHSNTIRMASNVNGAKLLFQMNGQSLNQSSQQRIRSYIQRLEEGDNISEIWWNGMAYLFMEENAPASHINGYRILDDSRLTALVVRLAIKCEDLFKTKLQKALFFCDFLAYEKFGRSLTGMRYAHADYGPIMDDYDVHISKMVRNGDIVLAQYGWGKVIAPASKTHDDVFSEEEEELIDCVAQFVNTFTSTTEISNYSHSLTAWKSTANGEIISYASSNGEVSKAVENRLNTYR